MIRYLEIDEILELHFWIIEDFGGSHGVCDELGLKSLVAAPRTIVFGEEQYVSVHEKAVVYLRNCIADHVFTDGNKRTAVTITGIFLARNGWRMTAAAAELENFAVRVATDHLDIDAIVDWLERHSRGRIDGLITRNFSGK